ncbi:MAG: lysophospholipid acyltransferase family protein [Acidobacteriaceae bacterium]
MRSILLLLFYVLVSVPTALVLLPWTLLTRNANPLLHAGLAITRTGLRLVGIRPVVSGRENLPRVGGCIFMANHVSNLDPPVVLPLLPIPTVVFLKRSLMKIPILGYAMHLAGFIPVSRDGSVEAAKQHVAEARAALAGGRNVLVFPEGTRSRDGRLLPFKKGPFHLAMESQAPVVPIAVTGTAALMPKGSLRLRVGRVGLHFHPPIVPANYGTREELMAAVRAAIESEVGGGQ